MNTLKLPLKLFLITAATTISVCTAQTCNACNCQLNNVQVLNQLVDARVNQILSGEPRKLFAWPLIQII